MVTAAIELRHLFLGRKAMTNLDNVLKKQRHYFADKGLYSQSYGFSGSHVLLWELDHKEIWALKNGCFWIVALENTLGGFPGGASGKESACQCRRHEREAGLIPGLGRYLVEEMATHSSILDWRIPQMEKPGGLWSTGSQRVGHE